ncbi:hypothetical protein CRG98_050434 [Punica granatum]|uniref:Uncharacterized protein n=1 Tax=Punica granatum TaxID=22663 RepID=A0A2I0GBK0_PUNGR|nr:hypothetical protein CRG98_050434 [Punica granatum]
MWPLMTTSTSSDGFTYHPHLPAAGTGKETKERRRASLGRLRRTARDYFDQTPKKRRFSDSRTGPDWPVQPVGSKTGPMIGPRPIALLILLLLRNSLDPSGNCRVESRKPYSSSSFYSSSVHLRDSSYCSSSVLRSYDSSPSSSRVNPYWRIKRQSRPILVRASSPSSPLLVVAVTN